MQKFGLKYPMDSNGKLSLPNRPNHGPYRESSSRDGCSGFWTAGVEAASGERTNLSRGLAKIRAQFQLSAVFVEPVDGQSALGTVGRFTARRWRPAEVRDDH